MLDKDIENMYKCVNYDSSPNCVSCDGYGRNLSCINTSQCYVIKSMIKEGEPGYEDVIGQAYPKLLEDKVIWYKYKFSRGVENVQSEE